MGVVAKDRRQVAEEEEELVGVDQEGLAGQAQVSST